jgi:hypothetical protein
VSVWLPLWAWCCIAVAVPISLLFIFGIGRSVGEVDGIDQMKREAIRAGVAKACDFDGGWRWWTREELAKRLTPTSHEVGRR